MASPRRFPWTTVLLVTGALVLIGLVGAYLWAMRQVVHAWYTAEYVPEQLAAPATEPPPEARVATVPWLRRAEERSPGLALQMLAAQHGQERPLRVFEFFMGATWGARGLPRQTSFAPGQDEDVGLRHAAPLLGLTRRYLTTDDEGRYLAALKTALASGRAVRVVVDVPALEGRIEEEAHPRDLVLIGYDGAGFEYYDPVCAAAAGCDAALPGAPGLKVAAPVLVEAVDRQALRFKYPWRYQLLVLEAGEPPPASARHAALERNARALIGTKTGGPSTGSYAVRDVATVVSKSGRAGFVKELEDATKLAATVRADDAAALRELFEADARVEAGAVKLEAASAAYLRAHQAFDKKESFALTDALLAAAAADQEAGEALLPGGDAGVRP